MDFSYMTVIRAGILAMLAAPAAFCQPPSAAPALPAVIAPSAAPTITILASATGALLRSQSSNNASFDLGRVSYFRGTSAPGQSTQKHSRSFVTITRFGLRVDCPGIRASSKVNVSMSRLDASPLHALAIDGTPVESVSRILVQAMPCGSEG